MPASQTQPRSIRWKMLVTVNAVLMTALLGYLAFDYREDWNKRLADKRSAMIEEARLLAPAVVRLSRFPGQGGPFMPGRRFSTTAPTPHAKEPAAQPDSSEESATQPSDANLSPSERHSLAIVGRGVASFQRSASADILGNFLHSLCERKQVTSDVNYQLAVRIGEKWYQEKKSDNRQIVPPKKLEEGVANPRGITLADGDIVVVVSDTVDDGAVYVVESLTKMMRQSRTALFWHVLAIGFIGLGVTAIVDLILLRLVSRPLGALVATVRRIKAGELGIKPPPGSSREVESLVGEVNQLSQSLALAQVHRVGQMDKARRVQERLFPSGESAGPVKVRSVHTAASIVGGDYFDHKVMPDGSILVILVDVSGHGVAAAMGAAMLKALFDANTRSNNGLLELVAAINQGFCEVSLDEDFATIIIVSIDPALKCIRYVNAGHETAYVIPRGGVNPLREMKSTGPLVGVMRDAEWTVDELPFEPGDRAVLLTDGVIECRSLAGDMLGRKRICSMLLKSRDTPFESFTTQVISDIEAFRTGIAPNDDLTLLTLEY